MSTKFILLINVKMPTIVGILTFISMINTTSERLLNFFSRHCIVYEHLKELRALTLKAPRKEMHLKMSSAEVVCCKKLPSSTDELSIEVNSVHPEQTAPI